MTNTVEFSVALIRAKLTQKDLSEKLGISENALSRKVNNLNEFKASEIEIIKQQLNLTPEERDLIFFNFISE